MVGRSPTPYAVPVPNLIPVVVLAVSGLGALALGIFTWRSATKLVTDARQTLVQMFGDAFPGLFTEEPDPNGARIAAAGFMGVGIALLIAALVQLVVG